MASFKIYPLHVGDLNRQKSNLAFMQSPGVKIDFTDLLVSDGWCASCYGRYWRNGTG